MRSALFIGLALISGVSEAAVRYSYSGPNFATVTTSAVPAELVPRTPTLTTADRIEGYLELPAALPANDFVLIDSSNATAFSFSSGGVSVSDFARLDSGNDYVYLETGASGEIVAWDIRLFEATPADATRTARQITLDSGLSAGGDRLEIADCADAACTGYFVETASTPEAGVFSGPVNIDVPAAGPARQVPLPWPAAALLAAGLAGAGIRRAARAQ